MLAHYRKAMPYVLGLYVVLVAALFVFLNLRLTIEWVAIILFVAALLSGRAMLFLRDWGVFIVVLLAWQLTAPLATRFSFPWHLTELIDADKFLFLGRVPPVWLQQHLYQAGKVHWWDVLAACFYLLHFLAPLAAGFALWMVNRPLFQKYMITYIVVFLGGFVTYVLYPAVPPWMAAHALVHVGNQYLFPWVAAKQGYPGGLHAAWQHSHVYLPHVQNLFGIIMKNWYNPYNGTIFFGFLHLSYDQVAAIPSEHAAYPLLFFLFLRRQFGAWAYVSLIYIAGLLFSITYLGQHYVIDAIVGFVYAAAGYALVMHLWPALTRSRALQAPEASGRVLTRAELEEA